MKNHHLQERIITHNKNYLLATGSTGSILYQEHFHPNALGKAELREILGIITLGILTPIYLR